MSKKLKDTQSVHSSVALNHENQVAREFAALKEKQPLVKMLKLAASRMTKGPTREVYLSTDGRDFLTNGRV